MGIELLQQSEDLYLGRCVAMSNFVLKHPAHPLLIIIAVQNIGDCQNMPYAVLAGPLYICARIK